MERGVSTRETDSVDDKSYEERRWTLDRKLNITAILSMAILSASAYFDIKSDIRSLREDRDWIVKMQMATDERQDSTVRDSVESIRRDISIIALRVERITENNDWPARAKR